MAGTKFFDPNVDFFSVDVYDTFDTLSLQQRMYLHFLSKAAWGGHLISFMQTSPESPLIFILLHRMLKYKSTFEELRNHLSSKHNFTSDEVNKLFLYAAAFFSNGGNYRDFGSSKFIPDVPQAKLASIAEEVLGRELIFYTEHCLTRMFDYSPEVRQLAQFPPKGISMFFSANCREEDSKLKLDGYNHRVFKTVNADGQKVYEIQFASVESTDCADDTPEQLIKSEHNFRGSIFKFTRGGYGKLLEGVNEELRKATRHPRNGQQVKMLNTFVKSFETGSLQVHKEATRIWIEDKLPIVECHFGFLENYRDPTGVRANFESFVAVVKIERTNLLTKLVKSASQLIEDNLPWPRGFEKDKFLARDFTSLDAISFAGYSSYSDVNFPKYNEIHQKEGFKNLHFANLTKPLELPTKYIAQKDSDLFVKYVLKAKDAQIIFRELLGHGSGKLLQETEDGTLNFKRNLIDPLTGKPVAKWYEQGETFNNVFGQLGNVLEECRADLVGLLLCSNLTALGLTGVADDELADVSFVNWLSMALLALSGLQTYDSRNNSWGQAHCHARFVILNMLQQKVPGLVILKEVINEKDRLPDLELTIDRTKLLDAQKALKGFLLQVQIYKSTADFESAQKLFTKYSDPSSTIVSLNKTFSDIRPIISQRSKEKTILVQPNTFVRDSEAVLWNYEASAEGCIKSFLDRFNNIEEKYRIMKDLYLKESHHFPLGILSSGSAQSPSSSEIETNASKK